MQSLFVSSHPKAFNRTLSGFARVALVMTFLMLALAGLVKADDTAIFVSRAVDPNVLFILDSSGSMTKILDWEWTSGDSIRDKSRYGLARHYLNKFVMGSDGNGKDRIEGIRIGVMSLNNIDSSGWFGHGGKIEVPVSTLTDEHRKKIYDYTNKIKWDALATPTPLAEALAEAGLYYAGQKSWVDGRQHKSPIEWRCQQNYVVMVTNGGPWHDRGGNLSDENIFFDDKFNCVFDSDCLDPLFYNMPIAKYDKNDSDYEYYSWNIAKKAIWRAGFTNGSNYLDNVAKYLYEIDLVPASMFDHAGNMSGTLSSGFYESGSGSFGNSKTKQKFWQQNIITYIIAVGPKKSDTALLESASDNNHGRGGYYEIDVTQRDAPDAFEDAITEIMNYIYNGAFSYSATAVPVSSSSQFFSGHAAYVPMFVPHTSGIWLGNLRKYALNGDGSLYDVSALAAVDTTTGLLGETAKDFWTKSDVSGADYSQVNYGGAGSVLTTKTSRSLYTAVLGTATKLDTTNDGFTPALFDLTTKTDKDKLLNYLCCADIYAPGGAADREWVLGDIMHSIPAALNEPANPTTKTAIFVGANDGLLHCFVDTHNTADDTWQDKDNDGLIDSGEVLSADSSIEEFWAFAPPEILPKLKYLHPELRGKNDRNHRFYVDGSPVIYKYRPAAGGVSANTYTRTEVCDTSLIDTETRLIFGLRRGGASYTILDILNGATLRSEPVYVPINQTGLITALKTNVTSLSSLTSNNLADYLGGSWSSPTLAMVQDDELSGDHLYRKVIFLAGGYDVAEDAIDATGDKATSRLKGSCAYALDAASGDVFSVFSHKDMLDSIVDLVVFDGGNDRIADTLYAPDLGGKLWRFSAEPHADDNAWAAKLIFDASGVGSYPRKFFNAPDVVLEPGYEYLFIGSGNREDPLRINYTTVDGTAAVSQANQERFYAIKLKKQANPLTEGDLLDITEATYASQAASIQANANGWYLRLTAPGEKVINRAVTVRGVVFFTTYQPFSSTGYAAGTDLCSPKVQNGVTRLYAINYRNGDSVMPTKDFETDNDPFYKSGLDDKRSLVLGQPGLPPQPSLVITDKGLSLVVGSTAIPLNIPAVATTYYWRYLD